MVGILVYFQHPLKKLKIKLMCAYLAKAINSGIMLIFSHQGFHIILCTSKNMVKRDLEDPLKQEAKIFPGCWIWG